MGVGRQGGDHPADVLRGLGRAEIERLLRVGRQDTLGPHEPRSDRQGGDPVAAQLDREAARHAIDRRLGDVVREISQVAVAVPGRGQDDQPGSFVEHEAGGEPRRHPVCPDPCVEHAVPESDRLVPERGGELRRIVPLVPSPDVADEDVETSPVAPDGLEQRLHVPVVGMVAGHGHADPPALIDRLRRLLHRAGETVRADPPAPAAARDVHGRPGVSESHRDPPATAAAGAGDHRDLALEIAHGSST